MIKEELQLIFTLMSILSHQLAVAELGITYEVTQHDTSTPAKGSE
ncbi:hypothetical protein JOD18_000438 [Gracilibacillus alcaliphilus]|nr:hypothetical protein [Gracilibacillus alcaliphilus]